MSTRSASIILDPQLAARRDEPATSDLQQMIARVLSVLRRRRWLFVFPLLTGILGALVVSALLPRRYQLSAIFERRDDVVITKLVTDNSPYSFSTLRQSLSISLAGYNAVGEAADQLGLTRNLPREANGELTPEGRARKQAMVVALGRQIEVALLEKSSFLDLIEVRYRGEDPDLGVRLVTQLKDNYISHTRAWISDIVVKARDFFQQEVGRRSEQAARMEAELLDISIKHPGVDPSDPDLLHERLLRETTALEDLSRRRAEIQSNITAREEYLNGLTSDPARLATSRPAALGTLAALPKNPQWQRIRREIEAVQAQISDARTIRRMTEQHPHVAGLNEKLRQLENQLDSEPEVLALGDPAGHPAAVDPLEGERRRVNMELKTLRETLDQLDREIPRREAERNRLEEEKGRLFERRQQFVMRQQELQAVKSDLSAWNRHLETISRVLVAEAEQRGIQFSTVEEARRPRQPSSPTIGGILLVSVGLGVALAVAVVFVREILDRTFRNAARVREALGIPVLEAVGEIQVDRPRRWFRRTRLLPVLASLEGMTVLGALGLVYLSVEQPAAFDQLVGQFAGMINGS